VRLAATADGALKPTVPLLNSFHSKAAHARDAYLALYFFTSHICPDVSLLPFSTRVSIILARIVHKQRFLAAIGHALHDSGGQDIYEHTSILQLHV
jgi:hypothetical protein